MSECQDNSLGPVGGAPAKGIGLQLSADLPLINLAVNYGRITIRSNPPKILGVIQGFTTQDSIDPSIYQPIFFLHV